MNNKLNTEYIIFQCIKFIIAFFKKYHCKISRIEKNIDLVDYLITFSYTSKRQIFVKPVTEIYKNSYLLNSFNPEDAAIIGFYHTMIHLEKLSKAKKIMNSEQANDFKFFTLFGMLLVASKLCAMLFAQRLISFYGIILPGGIIPFCTTFMVLDIVTNNYGFRNARKIIFFNLICEAVMAFTIQATLKITPSFLFQHELACQEFMSPFIKLFTASLFGTVIAYLLNCYVFSRLYYSFKGKHLWLRCILATALGELVFSIIWTMIFFWKQLSIDSINALVTNQYLFKVLFEIITLPITYLAVYLLNKYELHVDIEYKNFKPLHKG